MYLQTAARNAVEYQNGEHILSLQRLQDFCNIANSNFLIAEQGFQTLRVRNMELSTINAKLIQFMNWLAVTNPQILDEFQTTANAFEKLSPRSLSDAEGSVTSS